MAVDSILPKPELRFLFGLTAFLQRGRLCFGLAALSGEVFCIAFRVGTKRISFCVSLIRCVERVGNNKLPFSSFAGCAGGTAPPAYSVKSAWTRVKEYQKKAKQPVQYQGKWGGECVEKTKEINGIDEIKPQEWQIIKLMRELDYGQLIISVKNGKPVHAETRKSITLTP